MVLQKNCCTFKKNKTLGLRCVNSNQMTEQEYKVVFDWAESMTPYYFTYEDFNKMKVDETRWFIGYDRNFGDTLEGAFEEASELSLEEKRVPSKFFRNHERIRVTKLNECMCDMILVLDEDDEMEVDSEVVKGKNWETYDPDEKYPNNTLFGSRGPLIPIEVIDKVSLKFS